METMTKVAQKIQLVDGTFSPSEAQDVITALIDQKINFHKLQRLAWCEGNRDADTFYPDHRIHELEEEKKVAKEFISSIRNAGLELRINGVLEISLV